MAPLRVANLHIFSQILLDSIQNRHIPGCGSLVIADQSLAVVRIRADHCDPMQLAFVQRQGMVFIFQQNQNLLGHFQVQGLHFPAIYRIIPDFVVGYLLFRIKHAQFHAGRKQPDQASVNRLLFDLAFCHSLFQIRVQIAAVEVTPVVYGQGHGIHRAGRDHMPFMEILDCPAVGRNMPLEIPLSAQNVHKKGFAAAARFTVCAVVGPHDCFHPGFLYKCTKGRKVRFPQILLGNFGIKIVPLIFRARMDCEMLGAGSGAQIVRVIALHTFHKAYAQARGQIRIFTIGFVPSAPARVTEYIYIRRPDRQALVDIPILIAAIHVVFTTRFHADGFPDLAQ